MESILIEIGTLPHCQGGKHMSAVTTMMPIEEQVVWYSIMLCAYITLRGAMGRPSKKARERTYANGSTSVTFRALSLVYQFRMQN